MDTFIDSLEPQANGLLSTNPAVGEGTTEPAEKRLPAQIRDSVQDQAHNTKLVPEGSEAIEKMVSSLNSISTQRSLRLEFSIHDDSGRVIIRVIDRTTDEIVRQFPSEELLSVAERLRDGGGLLEALAG